MARIQTTALSVAHSMRRAKRGRSVRTTGSKAVYGSEFHPVDLRCGCTAPFRQKGALAVRRERVHPETARRRREGVRDVAQLRDYRWKTIRGAIAFAMCQSYAARIGNSRSGLNAATSTLAATKQCLPSPEAARPSTARRPVPGASIAAVQPSALWRIRHWDQPSRTGMPQGGGAVGAARAVGQMSRLHYPPMCRANWNLSPAIGSFAHRRRRDDIARVSARETRHRGTRSEAIHFWTAP